MGTPQVNLVKNPRPFSRRAEEMEAPKVTCLRLLVLILEQTTEFFILSTTSFSRKILYQHHHRLNAPVVQAVEIVRESAQGMMDAASQRLDGANEIVRKGLVGIMEHFAQKTVMMMVMTSQQKYALAASIVLHVRQRWLPTKDVAGNPQKKVWYTVMRSGVHVSVPVVQAVEIVRESAQGRMDVASRILEHFAQKTVMMMAMISLLKFALAVIIVLDASKRWWTKKAVAENLQKKVWYTAKRSMASVLLNILKGLERNI